MPYHIPKAAIEVGTSSALHLDVPTGILTQALEQITSFEVLVGVNNRLQLHGAHDVLVPGLLYLGLVKMLENPAPC